MEAGGVWRDASVARCRRALGVAKQGADRCALLRTLAWLKGGRIDCVGEGLKLLPSDAEYQVRFGYRVSDDQSALWLRDRTPLPEWWPQDLHVDPADRRALRPGSADAALRRLTDRRSYRNLGQKGAIRALLTQKPGSGLLASMPTGAGKSLIFQLAALIGKEDNFGACVVVIVPTVALALDHQRSLKGMRGLEGSLALTSNLDLEQLTKHLNAFRRGEVPILLLGPEMALRDDVQTALVEAVSPEPSAFGLDARLTHFVVDEAHIVESWGRNFRPDFQRLPGLLRRLRDVDASLRLILLSATIPSAARKVLRRDWAMGAPWLEVNARVPRFEHDVIVAAFKDVETRNGVLDQVIDLLPRPAILYTTEINAAESFHSHLKSRGYERLALFTGNSTSDERQRVVDAWANDGLDIVVATSAFGMGVDKADVRSVVHACLPEGPSRWYQEIGRAARDGGQGIAALLFVDRGGTKDDVSQARGLSQSGWLTREKAELRWDAMKNSVSRKWVGDHLRLQIDLDAVRKGLASRSFDYNRTWNRSLLMLMQRAGAIKIASVSGGDGDAKQVWAIDVIDSDLLGASQSSWDRIFELREREIAEAKAMFDPFLRGVRNPENGCTTQLAFELIEPSAIAPPCGRCPYCRYEQIATPTDLTCGGLDVAWGGVSFTKSSLQQGLTLVEPSDTTVTRGLDLLLRRLASLGIDQWVVPDDLADTVASQLAILKGTTGIVMTFGEWVETAVLAELPTTLILPSAARHSDEILQRFVDWVEEREERIGLLVTDPTRVVGGRRLDQWSSRFAPIQEAELPLPMDFKEVPS